MLILLDGVHEGVAIEGALLRANEDIRSSQAEG
jgi:hypothetical protein